ncbi:MAG: hypothetical protein GF401_07850 [Chitinivibrionales bacterium]|nr:hypothetical protein [Chitinivibrionales bacterium]
MQRTLRFVVPLLAFIVSSSFASIKLHIAGTSELEAALGKGSDSLWFRTAAYDSMLSGAVEVSPALDVTDSEAIWADSVYTSGPNVYANKMPNPMQWKFDNYLVVGVAEDFQVPEDGEYVFTIKADNGLFIEIDGQIISDNPSENFMYATLGEDLDPGLGADGIPAAEEYQATVTLTAGSHDFKIYFWEGSSNTKAELWWKKPGETDSVVVPASAFPPRRDFCEFEIEWIDPECAPGDDDVPTPLTLPFRYPPKPCVEPPDTIWYVYDFFEEGGTPDGEDIRTTEAVYETTFVTCQEQEVVEYVVWAETNDGRQSQVYEGSCNVIYVYGPDTAECGTHALEWGLSQDATLKLEKEAKSQVFNVKGQRVNDKVLLDANKTLPASGQYIIKQEAVDSKKARLRKKSAVK